MYKWVSDDRNGDGKTTIDEVQRCINQFLGISPVEPCNDLNDDGHGKTSSRDHLASL